MALLYSNENFPAPVVTELRRLGHDVLTTAQAGKSEQALSDAEVLKFAHAQGRAVITLNRRHFVRLHKQSSEHSGIVVCSHDRNSQAFAQRIHDAIAAHQQLQGKLVRVDRPA
jgi:hypothetical protein